MPRAVITDNAIELLDAMPSNAPWYLEINLQNPHHPWDITERMHQLYRGEHPTTFPQPVHSEFTPPVSATQHQEVRRNFAAMVEDLDRNVGRVLAKLEAAGELDNTVVVFSADHGEMLGDCACKLIVLSEQPYVPLRFS
jgi:choline-sulfatase